MARQSVITQKKRGPAATGKGTLVGVRLLPEPLSSLDEWAQSQPDAPTRPEAIRRLIALGLKVPPVPASVEGLTEYYNHIGRTDLAQALLGVMKDIKP